MAPGIAKLINRSSDQLMRRMFDVERQNKIRIVIGVFFVGLIGTLVPQPALARSEGYSHTAPYPDAVSCIVIGGGTYVGAGSAGCFLNPLGRVGKLQAWFHQDSALDEAVYGRAGIRKSSLSLAAPERAAAILRVTVTGHAWLKEDARLCVHIKDQIGEQYAETCTRSSRGQFQLETIARRVKGGANIGVDVEICPEMLSFIPKCSGRALADIQKIEVVINRHRTRAGPNSPRGR